MCVLVLRYICVAREEDEDEWDEVHGQVLPHTYIAQYQDTYIGYMCVLVLRYICVVMSGMRCMSRFCLILGYMCVLMLRHIFVLLLLYMCPDTMLHT
jgi:hypothetical protein